MLEVDQLVSSLGTLLVQRAINFLTLSLTPLFFQEMLRSMNTFFPFSDNIETALEFLNHPPTQISLDNTSTVLPSTSQSAPPDASDLDFILPFLLLNQHKIFPLVQTPPSHLPLLNNLYLSQTLVQLPK